jgi:uncharacterized protein YndB with AHSA1/START domain
MSMITVSTAVAALPAHVWKCWTSAQDVAKWNFASDGWHCPAAVNELRVGGKFTYRMAARDGSAEFDFEGVYSVVDHQKRIEFSMSDGRRVIVQFGPEGEGTRVTESFDPESEHSEDMQRQGWQAILDNFRKHAEASFVK